MESARNLEEINKKWEIIKDRYLYYAILLFNPSDTAIVECIRNYQYKLLKNITRRDCIIYFLDSDLYSEKSKYSEDTELNPEDTAIDLARKIYFPIEDIPSLIFFTDFDVITKRKQILTYPLTNSPDAFIDEMQHVFTCIDECINKSKSNTSQENLFECLKYRKHLDDLKEIILKIPITEILLSRLH